MSANQAEAVYKALEAADPKTTRTVTDDDSNQEYECFELKQVPELAALVSSKCPAATHANVETLHPESNKKVFNILFFADDDVVAGCEITSTKVVWDDDLEYDEDK
jgi:hypothetical protein